MKVHWKTQEPQFYTTGADPVVIRIPGFRYFVIHGEGSPDSAAFSKAVETLYALSYSIRMSDKKGLQPAGFHPYTVYPLEGIWDLTDDAKRAGRTFSKADLSYRVMIRQPDFVTQSYAMETIARVSAAKSLSLADQVTWETIEDGLCMQYLHIGPFADEAVSFARMEEAAIHQGYSRLQKSHREIYLSDPRRVEPARLKTLLRFKLKENS